MSVMTMNEINAANRVDPAAAYTYAVEEFRADPVRLAGFLQECSTAREVCLPFGFISVPELLAMMRNPKATDEQVVLAVREIDRRALAYDAEALAERETALSLGVLS